MTRAILLSVPFVLASQAMTLQAFATPIGSAINVSPQASLEAGAETVTLAIGRAVESNNRVITGPAGATRLKFLDSSVLDVGAGATVTLDEFVYSGNKADKAALTMSKGAFRWVTGNSEKKNYDLRTPLAAIGIRGTDFRVDTDEGLTTIRLNSGALTACSRVSQTCASIDRPRHGIRLFADGRVEMFIENGAVPPVTRFASLDATPPAPPPAATPPRQRRAAAPAPVQPRQRVRQPIEEQAPPPRRRVADYTPPPRIRPPRIVEEPIYDEPVYIPPRRPPVVWVPPRPRPNPCPYGDCVRPPRWPQGDGGYGRPPRPHGPYGDGGVRIPRMPQVDVVRPHRMPMGDNGGVRRPVIGGMRNGGMDIR